MKIYLAGPEFRAVEKGREWRDAVKVAFGDGWRDIEWVDPIADMDYDLSDVSDEEVVENDKALIDECDGMLVGLTRHGTVGTWREVEYAVETVEIPVVYWLEPGGSPSREVEREFSPWMTEAGPVFVGFEEAIEQLIREVDDE